MKLNVISRFSNRAFNFILWRYTAVANHVWYCRDMTADRDNCQLHGMTQKVGDPEADDGRRGYNFWPTETPPDEDKLPDGSPLTLPPNSMADDKVYTVTLLSTKPSRESLPDMAGRCRLALSTLVLKPRMVSALEAEM
jgi:hypothetical protein